MYSFRRLDNDVRHVNNVTPKISKMYQQLVNVFHLDLMRRSHRQLHETQLQPRSRSSLSLSRMHVNYVKSPLVALEEIDPGPSCEVVFDRGHIPCMDEILDTPVDIACVRSKAYRVKSRIRCAEGLNELGLKC